MWDGAVARWIAACTGLAVWTGISVHRLEPVGETLLVSSRALDETATAIDRLSTVPFVGDALADVGGRIAETQAETDERAA
jgi:hypothetical protein